MIKILARYEADGRIHAAAFIFIFGYAFQIGRDTVL